MLHLDCTNEDSAATTLAGLFGTTADELRAAVRVVQDDPVEDAGDPIGAVLPRVVSHLGAPAAPETVCFFHGTRAVQPETFESGLKPLSECIEVTWSQISALVPELSRTDAKTLAADMREGFGPHTYRLRIVDARQHGPYGHLVRDALLHPEEYSAWDYLGGPEIVVDICEAIADRFEIDALERFRLATQPCIIKFRARPTHVSRSLVAALWFVEAAGRGERSINANWGHDGEGSAIPPDDILSIETVPVREPNNPPSADNGPRLSF